MEHGVWLPSLGFDDFSTYFVLSPCWGEVSSDFVGHIWELDFTDVSKDYYTLYTREHEISPNFVQSLVQSNNFCQTCCHNGFRIEGSAVPRGDQCCGRPGEGLPRLQLRSILLLKQAESPIRLRRRIQRCSSATLFARDIQQRPSLHECTNGYNQHADRGISSCHQHQHFHAPWYLVLRHNHYL